MIDEMVATLKKEQTDDDFAETNFLALDSQCNEIKLGSARGLADSSQSKCATRNGAHLDLHKACAGQSFLEQFKSIIVIQPLNGVGQSKKLLIACVDNFR